MLRLLYSLCLLACVSLSTGCAMCCHPYDECYNAFGGAVPRCEQCCGRVASVFDPAECYGGEGDGEMYQEGATEMAPAPTMPAPSTEPAMRPYVQSQRLQQPAQRSVLK